ncbi:hypothetical protein TNCV_675151 [Trichonephila clavipes]|nr:hypothetical protein TNCV_675151 [Trichonephila clavipes]
MNKVWKTPAGLDCPIVLSIIVAVGDDNVYSAPIMADTDILEFVQSSKNTIDVGSVDEFQMNNSASVPTSAKMRNVMENMCSYLDAHSNGEMDNKNLSKI